MGKTKATKVSKKPKQQKAQRSALEIEYSKQIKRINDIQSRLRRQGYFFTESPVNRGVINEEYITYLKSLKTAEIRAQAYYKLPDGTIISGDEAAKYITSTKRAETAAKKGKTREVYQPQPLKPSYGKSLERKLELKYANPRRKATEIPNEIDIIMANTLQSAKMDVQDIRSILSTWNDNPDKPFKENKEIFHWKRETYIAMKGNYNIITAAIDRAVAKYGVENVSANISENAQEINRQIETALYAYTDISAAHTAASTLYTLFTGETLDADEAQKLAELSEGTGVYN